MEHAVSHISEAPQNAFEALAASLSPQMDQVERLIKDRLRSDTKLIEQVSGHIVGSGGKRLRPLLTVAAATLCGYDGDRHLGLGASVEFIHTASLLHDDVVDMSELRRGKESAHMVFGNAASVLVGDYMFSKAFELMVDDGGPTVLGILCHASATISEGEVMQLSAQQDMGITVDEHFAIVEAKTAALFAAACEIGPVVAKATDGQRKALHDYGHYLGMAFQLADDVLDYSSAREKLGKSSGDDFREGKVTLPVILSYQKCDEAEKAFWRSCLEDGNSSDENLAQARKILAKYDTLKEAIDHARNFVEKAKQSLALFEESPLKTHLCDLAEFTISREY